VLLDIANQPLTTVCGSIIGGYQSSPSIQQLDGELEAALSFINMNSVRLMQLEWYAAGGHTCASVQSIQGPTQKLAQGSQTPVA